MIEKMRREASPKPGTRGSRFLANADHSVSQASMISQRLAADTMTLWRCNCRIVDYWMHICIALCGVGIVGSYEFLFGVACADDYQSRSLPMQT